MFVVPPFPRLAAKCHEIGKLWQRSASIIPFKVRERPCTTTPNTCRKGNEYDANDLVYQARRERGERGWAQQGSSRDPTDERGRGAGPTGGLSLSRSAIVDRHIAVSASEADGIGDNAALSWCVS